MNRSRRSRRLALAPALFCAVLLGLAGPATAQKTPTIYDEPAKKTVLTLRGYPDKTFTSKLTCLSYPGFMVKEIDAGEKGAVKLSITPLKPGAAAACAADTAGEIELREWSGYADGAKGDYVFFNPDDGSNGGYPFAVYDGRTGDKLFEDSRDTAARQFRSLRVTADGLVIRFRRSVQGACSLYQGRSDCWGRIKKDLGLPYATPMPDCNRAYETERKRTPKFANEIAALATMIGYEAEATFRQGKLTVASQPGTVRCWLPD